MSSEVKIYRLTGYMLIGHDRLPTWQKFTLEIRALSERDAIEKAYSLLGSRHKLKRSHINIVDIREITLDEVTNPEVARLLRAERIVKQ